MRDSPPSLTDADKDAIMERQRREIARLKDLVREAFNAGWDSREQIITTRHVKGREHVFTAWLDQMRAKEKP